MAGLHSLKFSPLKAAVSQPQKTLIRTIYLATLYQHRIISPHHRIARLSISTSDIATMASTQTLPEGLQEELAGSHARRNPDQSDRSTKPIPAAYELPKEFLTGPTPKIKKDRVNFAKGGLHEYADAWAVVLDNVMTEEECNQLVAAAEATTNGKWERALVNIGGGMQAMYEDTRKCGRIIWDDREIMEKLWARIESSVPEIHRLNDWADVMGNGPVKRKETWKMTRLNERGRYLKYVGGEYFKRTHSLFEDSFSYTKHTTAHCDGAYETPDRKERSYFTLHLYLNDAVGEDGEQLLEGGATTFFSWNMFNRIDVVPKCGRVLLFQHRDLLHSGDDVISGTKLTLRTDIMYTFDKDRTAE